MTYLVVFHPIASVRKGGLAIFAGVRFDARMNGHVFLQSSFLGERLFTNEAHERVNPRRMSVPHVHLQGESIQIRLVAQLACDSGFRVVPSQLVLFHVLEIQATGIAPLFLPCRIVATAHVVVQDLFTLEDGAADGTDERLSGRVHILDVALQILFRLEQALTQRALVDVCLLAQVLDHVLFIQGLLLKSFAAIFALDSDFACVRMLAPDMLHQHVRIPKTPTAQFAFERLLVHMVLDMVVHQMGPEVLLPATHHIPLFIVDRPKVSTQGHHILEILPIRTFVALE